MRSKTSNKTLLIGGVAALVLLGGGGLYMTLQKPTATPGTSVILSSGPVGIQPTRMP